MSSMSDEQMYFETLCSNICKVFDNYFLSNANSSNIMAVPLMGIFNGDKSLSISSKWFSITKFFCSDKCNFYVYKCPSEGVNLTLKCFDGSYKCSSLAFDRRSLSGSKMLYDDRCVEVIENIIGKFGYHEENLKQFIKKDV